MSRSNPLGRLVIAWGPEANSLPWPAGRYERIRKDPDEFVHGFHDYHANAYGNDPDPFASRNFGEVVKALHAGRTVVLTDPVFDAPERRRLVERAFQRTFPDLVIEQLQLGGGPVVSGEEADREEADQGIVIDDDVYGEGEMASNESIVVESDAPRDKLLAALSAAARRMLLVGEDGQEYDVATLNADNIDVYTPNYVTDVTVDESGDLGFYIDCKGAIEPPMAARFRQILIEELQWREIFSAHVRVRE